MNTSDTFRVNTYNSSQNKMGPQFYNIWALYLWLEGGTSEIFFYALSFHDLFDMGDVQTVM